MTTLATLIILGASVRAAAESAVRAGMEPHCIDLFADADTRMLGESRKIERYPTEFLTALQQAPDAPWLYTGSLENYPRLISRMAKVRPLLGNGAETLELVRDPQWLARVVGGTGIRFPEAHAAEDFVPPDKNWLLKPRRSGGGMGVAEFARIQSPHEPEFWRIQLRRKQLWQRFVPGEAFSASFLAKCGRASPRQRDVIDVELLGTAGQWSGPEFGAPLAFQYAGSYAPFALTAGEVQQLTGLATKLATAGGLQGLFGLDLIRGRDGLWLIEVNPRYTASMELLEGLSDRSFVAEHCAEFGYTLADVDANVSQNYLSQRLSTGHSTPSGEAKPRDRAKLLSKLLSLGLTASDSTATLGKLIVYADNGGIVGDGYQTVIDVIKPLSTVIAGVIDSVITKDVPTAGSVIERGSPICTVIASAESPGAVRERLSQAAEQIRQSLDPLPAPS